MPVRSSSSSWLASVVWLRLLLQHRVEALEQGHAALQELVVVRNRLDEAVDGEVDARGFVAGELPVVQVGLVDDLADHPHPAILDAEPLDQGLERAVLAVMTEVGAEDVERDSLAGDIGGVGKGKLRVRIAETLDEPRGGDPIDVGSWARDPRAASRGKRRTMAPDPGRRPTRLRRPQSLRRRLPQGSGALPDGRPQVVDGLDPV